MDEDWYSISRKEFLFDLWVNTETTPEDAEKIYAYLVNQGLIDYDIEKEYLYDNYVEEEDD